MQTCFRAAIQGGFTGVQVLNHIDHDQVCSVQGFLFELQLGLFADDPTRCWLVLDECVVSRWSCASSCLTKTTTQSRAEACVSVRRWHQLNQ